MFAVACSAIRAGHAVHQILYNLHLGDVFHSLNCSPICYRELGVLSDFAQLQGA